MSFALKRTYRFEAAHWLPAVPDDHRCRKLHGHSYRIVVEVSDQLDPECGWVVDFAVIDAASEPLIATLDHTCLNEIAGLENPTSELLALWLWQRLDAELAGLSAISVAETPDSCVTYRGR
jgi:6-pyruvoyltetrahydropterin/6-carboxytetrahydropterin synthase